MKKYLFIVAIAITSIACKPAQSLTPVEAVNKLGPNPHFIINGQSADNSALETMNEEDVATLTTYYGKDAINRYGYKAKDGAVEIETKVYSREKYQKVLIEASKEYKSWLEAEGNDSGFQYVLNGKALINNFEGDLASITPDLLKEIKIIRSEELNKHYNISGKIVGVIITASPPKSLYNGKDKFNQK